MKKLQGDPKLWVTLQHKQTTHFDEYSHEPHYSAIIKAIDELAENPRPHGYKKLTGRNGYRIRVGAYRIIYDIFDTTLIVEIVNLGSRGDIYED